MLTALACFSVDLYCLSLNYFHNHTIPLASLLVLIYILFMADLPALDSSNQLPAFAWPGGYPIIYLDRENSTLCASCATKSYLDTDEVPQFKPVAYDVYYEGPTIQCDQCNVDIESAYGDPEVNQ